ncbi:MAG: acetylxylan esterase [Actinomycetales bacterium]|nr:acetylxylan esterase [Actinomycetales bacterium]
MAARTPFLCGIARSIEVTDAPPYLELGQYLAVHRLDVERVLEVLDHVDVAFLARRVACPAWISVGLADATCPPSGIFAAINAITAVVPHVTTCSYNGHEAGGPHDDAHLAGWLAAHLTP